MAESVRGGIISIDPGQTEGAKAIGMTHVQTMTSVILPQAIRNIMPQIGNNFIINIKDTSVMFIIGFMEFFAAHRNIVGVNLHVLPLRHHRDGRLPLHDADGLPPAAAGGEADGRLRAVMSWCRPTPLTMTAGTYSHPNQGTPFDERSREYRERIRQSSDGRAGEREDE